MDTIIRSLSEILITNNKEISDLLVLSKHYIDQSSTFGSMPHSIISTFEIISPPVQTSKLNALNNDKKNIILTAVLLLFPVRQDDLEITKIRFVADPLLSSDVEFIQYISDEELINNISIAINLLERKPPKFWIDYKESSESNLLENDYRSEFFRMLGMKYQVSSEEESKGGRTDLTLQSTSINRKIFEFKIWKRNDYLDSSKQLLGYLTEIEDTGFIIMANCHKTKSIKNSDYETIIKSSEYVDNSFQTKYTKHGLKYFVAEYIYKGTKKKIFHFILNLK